jgi:hypothetical protein
MANAILSFRATAKFSPNPRTWSNLGVALSPTEGQVRENGHLETLRESTTCQFRALELDPDYMPAQEALEELETGSDDPMEASMQTLYMALELFEVGGK